MGQVIQCDAPDCRGVIAAGEKWVEVSVVLAVDRPPMSETLGERLLHFHEACAPSSLAPANGEFLPRPRRVDADGH